MVLVGREIETTEIREIDVENKMVLTFWALALKHDFLSVFLTIISLFTFSCLNYVKLFYWVLSAQETSDKAYSCYFVIRSLYDCISVKPGFHTISNGRRRSAINEWQTLHKCFHILLAIADQVIPQVLICLVRN